MHLEEFLTNLRKLDVTVRADGTRLRCSAPPGALTPALEAELARRKPEILRFLNSANPPQPGRIPPLKPLPRNGPLPLSFGQERLWIIHQMEPASPAYNLLLPLRLSGALHVPVLEAALNEIVQRHEALRTTFALLEDRPVQLIAPNPKLILSLTDLRHLPEAEAEATLRRLIREEGARPFDLNRELLLRAQLWRMGENDQVLLLNMHHIASDGWSIGVLFHELSQLYAARSSNQPCPLPPLTIQYADFAIWQRNRLQGAELEGHLKYWKKQLADLPHLALPTDFPRPAVQSYRGGIEMMHLPASCLEQLLALGQKEGATLFMVLLAAFQTLLHRYTGQTDIACGSPIANRNRLEVENLIGFFVNSLVLRTDLSGNPTFRELLRRVRDMALEAFAHQDVPFEKLVEDLQPDRDMSRNPLFQVVFALQNAPVNTQELTGLKMAMFSMPVHTTRFDLEVHCFPHRGGLTVGIGYCADLFETDSIRGMLGHFRQLLSALLADPNTPLSAVPLLAEEERRQLLEEWNQTTVDYPSEKSLGELFEEQAAGQPEAIAVVCGKERLTYGELNARANQLAHALRKRGVGREELVGLLVDRSVELLVGMLGIVKAGGAYVPLDIGYPAERLRFMLEDTGAAVVVTTEGCRGRVSLEGTGVICLDQERQALGGESEENPAPQAGGESLLYIMYTSGSTGRPKGVAVVHRGVSRLLFGVDYVALGSGERVLQLAPTCFDASTFEIWGGLLHGGRCVMYPEEVPTVEGLGRVLREEGVSVMWLTAALFNTVIDERAEVLRPVKQLLIGGEALSVGHVRRALEQLPQTAIINGYGPTEGTTFTCCYRIPREVPGSWRSIPLGGPIGNTEVYVLDRWRQPVPVGVVGELYIGGAGLARGYWRREAVTAERFVGHPFRAGARLYRTGDQVRWRRDGTVEFMGRQDEQVKIRGFRVELGEVEAVLRGCEGVKDCVVVLGERGAGGKELVGYVVGVGLESGELRQRLKEKLPGYMVPGRWVILEKLPLTPNGKVDRRRLPAPEERGDRPAGGFLPPRTATERQVATIWAEVLQVPRVSMNDDFFALGGHSLLATRVASRLRNLFRIELPLRHLFEAGTVAEIARYIEVIGGAVPVHPSGEGEPVTEYEIGEI